MKLIAQIPAYNEELTLAQTVKDIPREIAGIERVEILIIDDGSTDRTVEVAKEMGVDHVVKNTCNKGLARTFHAGLDASLKLKADIIVNTDGDNQYQGQDIPKLIDPILKGKADIVIGDRQAHKVKHFSASKKKLQKIGSLVVRLLSETTVPDAVSGFRAFSREAAMQMNIVSPYSYTIETIIQAGKKRLAVTSVDIDINPETRESRLFKGIPESNKKDLVFDSYGKAIFKHHPMESNFLIYFPQKFQRLDELKKSNVKYLIKDYYYRRLPEEILRWFEQNFVQSNEHPDIFIKKDHIDQSDVLQPLLNTTELPKSFSLRGPRNTLYPVR
ncbi:MAG: glycosyltransferase family 2 protein [Candidatus Hodarchaeales archaeon]|jgi:glycosyltransferase involved in cell wall biosynthesis